MDLTKEQAKFLIELSGQIQDQYGIVIGYNNPALPAPSTREADFMIFEHPELGIQCFHKDDIQTKPMGPYLVQVVPNEPEYDIKVEELLERVKNDLFEGKIWFDPGVTRIVNGLEIEVTRKIFSGIEVFDTNIFTEQYGTVYTYDIIKAAAQYDKRFQIAKDIIDEVWPRFKDEEAKSYKDNSTKLISKIFKLFGF